MAKSDLYQKMAFSDVHRDRAQSDTYRSLQRAYADELDVHLNEYGYAVRGRASDPSVQTNLSKQAHKTARTMQKTYNAMLLRAMDEIPEEDDVTVRSKLRPFFNRVHTHNESVLIPFLVAWAAQRAAMDFYSKNHIRVLWQVQPQTTDQNDDCLTAINYGAMTTSVAEQFEFPNHRRCPHRLVPLGADPHTLPDVTDLWYGQGIEQKSWDITQKQQQKFAQTPLIVAFDLDNTALRFPHRFVPLAKSLASSGHTVGVITGNTSVSAREEWDSLGYPKPVFYEVVGHESNYETEKAQVCRKIGVHILIDDFSKGKYVHQFLAADVPTLPLQVLLPEER